MVKVQVKNNVKHQYQICRISPRRCSYGYDYPLNSLFPLKGDFAHHWVSDLFEMPEIAAMLSILTLLLSWKMMIYIVLISKRSQYNSSLDRTCESTLQNHKFPRISFHQSQSLQIHALQNLHHSIHLQITKLHATILPQICQKMLR